MMRAASRIGARERLLPLVFCGWMCLGLSLVSRRSQAETLQAPAGGKAIPLGDARTLCDAPSGGWTFDDRAHTLLPPPNADAVGTAVDLKIAASKALCPRSKAVLKLVTTGPWPSVDPASIVFAPDQASVEARGRRLTGVAVAWRASTDSGVDTCQNPKLEPSAEHCSWTVGHNMSASPGLGLVWLPPGGRVGPEVVTFDSDGRQATPDTFVLLPARVNLAGLLPSDASIDLSTGSGSVPIAHPESIAAVDCGDVRCEVSGDKLTVRALSSNVNLVDVKFKLRPGVFVAKGQGFDATPIAHLAVVHCPMSVASVPPLRGVENARVVVRIEGRCASDLSSLRFFIGNAPADVLSTQTSSTGSEALLRVGSTDASSFGASQK